MIKANKHFLLFMNILWSDYILTSYKQTIIRFIHNESSHRLELQMLIEDKWSQRTADWCKCPVLPHALITMRRSHRSILLPWLHPLTAIISTFRCVPPLSPRCHLSLFPAFLCCCCDFSPHSPVCWDSFCFFHTFVRDILYVGIPPEGLQCMQCPVA